MCVHARSYYGLVLERAVGFQLFSVAVGVLLLCLMVTFAYSIAGGTPHALPSQGCVAGGVSLTSWFAWGTGGSGEENGAANLKVFGAHSKRLRGKHI